MARNWASLRLPGSCLPSRSFPSSFSFAPSFLPYDSGVIQVVVQAMAWVMQKTMKVSGAEALCVAANVFIGQTEAPVLVAPVHPRNDDLGASDDDDGRYGARFRGRDAGLRDDGGAAVYLITASVMAAPGTFLIAKILWPETEAPATTARARIRVEKTSANFIDAAASGASQGMILVLTLAMLIAFVALIAMANGFLGWVCRCGDILILLQEIFGFVFGPLAYLLGVPKSDTAIVGNLIANKTVINEFFAFSMMKDVAEQLSVKGRLIATFALCGFANFLNRYSDRRHRRSRPDPQGGPGPPRVSRSPCRIARFVHDRLNRGADLGSVGVLQDEQRPVLAPAGRCRRRDPQEGEEAAGPGSRSSVLQLGFFEWVTERVSIADRRISGFSRSTESSVMPASWSWSVGSTAVAVLSGRSDYYEGRSMEEVVFPVGSARLGVRAVVLRRCRRGPRLLEAGRSC